MVDVLEMGAAMGDGIIGAAVEFVVGGGRLSPAAEFCVEAAAGLSCCKFCCCCSS
jgi:hypothetical protein